jgi:hypothetical protein
MVRKMMLAAAVAILMLPAMTSAQSTVTATATVSPTAVVGGSGDLAFGALDAVTNNVINATAGATTRTVTFNHDIDVSFDNVPTELVGTGANLPVSLECAWAIGAAWSAAEDCSTAVFAIDVGSALTVATLGFGGTILAADVANAPAGDYTASFDIVVEAR